MTKVREIVIKELRRFVNKFNLKKVQTGHIIIEAEREALMFGLDKIITKALADQQAGFRELIGSDHHYGGGDEVGQAHWDGYNEAKREIRKALHQLLDRLDK